MEGSSHIQLMAFKYCRCVVLEISFNTWNETEEPLRTVVVVAISLPGMADDGGEAVRGIS